LNRIVKLFRPAVFLLPAAVSGCSLSPAIPVLGAAFPGWFFCLLASAFLLIPTHLLVVRKGWQPKLSPLILSYLALMFLYAAILWFLFFVS
jgi:hypothetical protein